MRSHQAERECLVAGHGHLVEREAARYRTWHIDRADLRQAGILGLLIAAARFDSERAVPFAAYARTWVRKEIQRAISQQEFPAVLPPDLTGRTVALRRALDEHADSLSVAAAALGISPATAAALHRQLHFTATEDDEQLPAPGYTLTDPEHAAIAQDFTAAARAAWPAWTHVKPTHSSCATAWTTSRNDHSARSAVTSASPTTPPETSSTAPKPNYDV